MKTNGFISNPSAAIWQRVIDFDGDLSPTAARALLRVRFSERDHAFLDELSVKARTGSLIADEQTQLDTFERLGCLLDILHSQARRALKKKAQEGVLMLMDGEADGMAITAIPALLSSRHRLAA